MVALPRFNVGKLSVKAPKYASESDFVSSMRGSMNELQTIFRKIFDGVEDATPQLMLRSLEPTFDKAKLYCPKDTHDLVNSAYLEITGKGGRARVEMGFAKGGKPPYAVFVHEVTSYHHKAPTRSKFLQAAMMEDLPRITASLISDYKVWLAGI